MRARALTRCGAHSPWRRPEDLGAAAPSAVGKDLRTAGQAPGGHCRHRGDGEPAGPATTLPSPSLGETEGAPLADTICLTVFGEFSVPIFRIQKMSH